MMPRMASSPMADSERFPRRWSGFFWSASADQRRREPRAGCDEMSPMSDGQRPRDRHAIQRRRFRSPPSPRVSGLQTSLHHIRAHRAVDDKLKRGLEKACWKRPISDAEIERVVAAVESELESNFQTEVESRHIGELLMQHLRELDEVAYVRFASVYRQFKDARDFVSELRPILKDRREL